MITPENRNDPLSVAAVALIAMCVVTFDHEALGHGSACLLLHGHIRVLTSAVFRCDVQSGWIDPAGPGANLLMGTLALAALRLVPERVLKFRLFLILVTAFSYFWEGGYLMHAMHRREGDLYSFGRFLFGDLSVWQRWLAGAAGLALYVLAARLTGNALLVLWPEAPAARAVARTAWLTATVGAALAALAYSGNDWGDLRDAVLEIGVASCPLLLIPRRSSALPLARPAAFIARDVPAIVLAAAIYALFVASLGRGLGS